MKLTALQSEFLNVFPAKYREHIVEFAKMVAASEVDVLMFTARKAACFFHCLEYLKIWNSGTKLIVSERAKDHDLGWISGKKVAIVDEVIVTGTNLSELIATLRANNAQSVSVYALFINKDWFVDDFLNGAQLKGFVPLSSADAQSLGTTIVESLHLVPRPYAVDYPITSMERMSQGQFLRLIDSTEWRPRLTYSKTLEHTSTGDAHIEYYSMMPRFSIDAFALSLGLKSVEDIVCKVRLYGRWETTGGPESERYYSFRLVPYFILPPLSAVEIDDVFSLITQSLGLDEAIRIRQSCINPKSMLRVIQYVVAAWIASLWIQDQQRLGLKMAFTNDLREIHYIFPREIHATVQALCDLPRLSIFDGARCRLNEPSDVNESSYAIENTFDALLRPFAGMYEKKEIRLRQLAKQHGRRVLEDGQFKSILNRLNEGISVPDLVRSLPFAAEDSRNAVSEFLDVAIDNGHVVPVTISRRTGVNSSETIFRGFRHGEETYLILKDREVFWLMLSAFFTTIRSAVSSDPALPIGPLFKIGAVSRIYVEKILVLFLRYGLHEGIFNQAFTGEGAVEGRMKVRVGVDLHGARLAIGKELPTEMSQENAFVNWLLEHNILRKHKSGGFLLGDYKSFNDGPDRTKKGKSKQFGILMSDVVTHLLKTPRPNQIGVAPAKRVNNTLVALSTCETASSTILAVGAELRRVHKEFGAFPTNPGIAALEFLAAVVREKGAFSNGRTAANSAYFKAKLYLTRESEKSVQFVEKMLSDSAPMSASMWETASEAFRRVWGRSTVKGENHFIINLLSTIVPLQFSIHLFEYTILSSCLPQLSEGAEKRYRQLPAIIDDMLTELDELAAQLGASDKSFYEAASAAIRRIRASVGRDWLAAMKRGSEDAVDESVLALQKHLYHAENLFTRIDSAYNQRGQIAAIRIYDSSMFISLTDAALVEAIRDLVQRAVERSGTGGPRGYSKPALNAQLSAGMTFREIAQGENTTLLVYVSGLGAAAWLGYLAAEAIKASQDAGRASHIGVVFGGNDSYSALISAHDGNLSVSPTLAGIRDEQVSTLDSVRGSLIAQAETGGNVRALGDFENSLDSILKSDVRRTRRAFVQHSQQLGGTLETRTYHLEATKELFRVVFLFTVQDELSTFLGYLRDSEISTRRQAPNVTEKMAWYATLGKEAESFEVVALLNREMGSHDAAALLGEVERRYSPSAMVLIGIAATLTSKPETLGDVVIPAKVLDAHQSVALPTGETNRSFDRPFPARERELIQGFLAENVERDILRVSRFGPVKHRVRMNVMEADAALLRDDSGTDRRRQAASSHSDKVDAYEMESAGVAAYLENSSNAPPTFVVKGLSDLGDPAKKDSDIRYTAARNAVIVALNLVDYVRGLGEGQGSKITA
jgi:nucleoside phosphorylase